MKAYLGIDVGSVSINIVVLSEAGEVITGLYLRTMGKPVQVIQEGLKQAADTIPPDVEIAGAGTTGSGRYLAGVMVGADVVKNEITAHAVAASMIEPDVQTVFEIGGQDSKYISIENGVVVDFEMNKVCAAGTGSFLEEQAEKLGIKIIGEFAELAASQVKASSMLLDSVRRFIYSTRKGEMLAAHVSLPDMFASVVDDISSMFPFKRVTVDASGVAAGAKVLGGQCVQDLFMNLLVNLVQLSPEEEAAIEVKALEGSLGGAPCWHITVASGTAVMPQGVGDSVFARLAPPDISKMARVSGAAFAGSIARALGGTFGTRAIDTDGGAGCVFDVSLKGAEAS